MAISLGEIFLGINARTDGLQKGLKQGRDSLGKFQKKSRLASISITKLGAGLAVLGVGLAKLTKEAVDAQETFSKFGTVFASVKNEAEETAKSLADSFGLSRVEAKKLLGDTGDLLSGFGFTGKAALDLSTEVNKLAVDLASFTNFQGGAAGASAALTKALLGERESVKSLGISILETDVKQELLQLSIEGVTFESERQAKAFATLRIAQRQSKNAIGDFARTSNDAANLIRVFKADINDIVVSLGQRLVPTLEKTIRFWRPWVKLLKETVDSTAIPEVDKRLAGLTDKLNINAMAIQNATQNSKANVSQLREQRVELVKQRNEIIKLSEERKKAAKADPSAPEAGGPDRSEAFKRQEKKKTEIALAENEARKQIAEDALNKEIELQLVAQLNAETNHEKKILLAASLAEFRKSKSIEVFDFQQQINAQLFASLTSGFGKTIAEVAKGQESLGKLSKKIVRQTTDAIVAALATQLAVSTATAIKEIALAKSVAAARAIKAEAGKGLLGLATATIAVTAFSALISKFAGFQKGGVVGTGTKSASDNVLIRARTGERVLTPEQNERFERGALGGGGGIVVNIIEPTVDSDSRLNDLADRVGGVVMDRLGFEARGIVN